MSDEEILEIVRGAFEASLKVGAPGLSSVIKNAVMLNAMTRVRFMLRQTSGDRSEPSQINAKP